MKAELLAVGSELLEPGRIESNTLHLTARLRELGIDVVARNIVADDADVLSSTMRGALGRADLVIATGGLGPTRDDLTREAAAAALGRRLQREEALIEALKRRFASFGRTMSPVNEQQADVIDGARVLPNPRGTAPGQVVEVDGRLLFLLPGPPREMEPMFEEQVLPVLVERVGQRVLRTRVLRIAGMGESEVEHIAAPIYARFTNPRTTILSGAGMVELHLTAEAASESEALASIEELASLLRNALSGRVFSEDGRHLHEVVAALLTERHVTLALAESCTGGLLASRLTQVAGASAFLERGYVTYANRAKVELLGVDERLIERHGAVSEEVAAAMAAGARRAAGADIAVAITGIAGPSGGTPEKPVGLVYIALAGAAGDRVRRMQFPGGDRERIRQAACNAALEVLRRGLLNLPSA